MLPEHLHIVGIAACVVDNDSGEFRLEVVLSDGTTARCWWPLENLAACLQPTDDAHATAH
jgi:hypothetical protein